MKNRISHAIVVLAVAMVALSAAAPEAFAQNVEASNLTLKKTYAKTSLTPMSIYPQNFGGSILFSPYTMVNCPKATNNCLLKIEVALQAWVNTGESLFLYARVDYHDGVLPSAQVVSVAPPDFRETRSYSWFVEVPQGDHLVEIFAWNLNDFGAGMDHGALTISVFK